MAPSRPADRVEIGSLMRRRGGLSALRNGEQIKAVMRTRNGGYADVP
jgi:hypothetical protein